MQVYIDLVCVLTVHGQELMCNENELIGFTGGTNKSTNYCQQGSGGTQQSESYSNLVGLGLSLIVPVTPMTIYTVHLLI